MKAKVGINCRCGTPFKLAERFFMKDQDLQELPQAFNLMHVLSEAGLTHDGVVYID